MIGINLNDNTKQPNRVTLLQVIKGHTMSISRLSINSIGTILVSGSEDQTIFIYRIERNGSLIKLEPIGYMDVPSAVTAFNWKPQTVHIFQVFAIEYLNEKNSLINSVLPFLWVVNMDM